jgi:hypothetical protein
VKKRSRPTLADKLRETHQATANGQPPKRADTPPGEPWARPVHFNRVGQVPPFPAGHVPPWLADWVLAEAEATQTPPDLAGNLALALAGAALARKVRVVIRPGWREPANIFTVVSLPPGERKSAVFADATTPLVEYEQAEQARAAPLIAEKASERRVMEERLKGIERKAAKENDPAKAHSLRREAKDLAKELARHAVPDPPQLFCDDVTPEKLTQLLIRQGGRMLLASPEGTAFEIAKGRYSETANFDVFLKGHAGDPLRTGRVNRQSEAIDHPALSCALAVQPDVIGGLADQASMRGRGFLARWLYSVPTSKVGTRKTAPHPVPARVAKQFGQGMRWMWELPPSPLDGQEAGRDVVFARGADEAMRELEQWLEPQLAEGSPLAYLAGWGGKLCGAVARLALILHMAATLGAGEGWTAPISREISEAAIALGRDYYLPHARAAFGLMGADERTKDAARVVAWLSQRLKCETVKVCKGGVTVTKRDIHAEVFGGSRTAEEVGSVCLLLVEHGHLRPAGPSWRRDSQVFEVNPYLGDEEVG